MGCHWIICLPTNGRRWALVAHFKNLRVFASLTVQQNIDVAVNVAKSGGQGHAEFVQSALEKFDLVERLPYAPAVLLMNYLASRDCARSGLASQTAHA